MTPVERVLERLAGVRKTASGWEARCPAHPDQRASLNVATGEKQPVLLHCKAGCDYDEILAALGFQRGELDGPTATNGTRTPPAKPAVRTTTYSVCDPSGTLIAIHHREDRADGKRMWWTRDGKPGLGGLKTRDLPLYRAQALAMLTPGASVVVTEGEKACQALTDRNVFAVATVCGAAGTPSDAVLEVLRGFDVVRWPDADTPGRTHMQRIGARLTALGIGHRAIDPWPEQSDGSDAADFTGTDDELAALVSHQERHVGGDGKVDVLGALGVLLSDVEPEPVEWLWEGRLAKGKLTILEGRPDEGKTTLALDLAARVSAGRAFPTDASTRPAAGVVVLTAEDGLADTIRPRLEAAGADLSRIVAPTTDEVISLDESGLDWIRRACARVEAALVIIDPLVAFMTGKVDAHRDQDVRRMLRPLRALAEECGVALLVLRHLRKAPGSDPKAAGGGSVGLGAAARVVLLAAPSPDTPEERVLARVKGNLSAPFPSLSYQLVPATVGALGTVRIAWGGPSDHTAEALLAATTDDAEAGALRDAMDAVRTILANGPLPSKTFEQQAKAAGIAPRTLDRARQRLSIRAKKQGDGWYVALPAAFQERQERQERQEFHARQAGVLGHRDPGQASPVAPPTEEFEL